MIMTIDQLKTYKRKAKAQRDNWKKKAILAEQEKIMLKEAINEQYAMIRRMQDANQEMFAAKAKAEMHLRAILERIAEYAVERRGMFASDIAAEMFGQNLRAGYWKKESQK